MTGSLFIAPGSFGTFRHSNSPDYMIMPFPYGFMTISSGSIQPATVPRVGQVWPRGNRTVV